jgi:hypothetical protein
MADQFQLPPGATAATQGASQDTGSSTTQQFSLPPGATPVDSSVPAPGTTGVSGFLNKVGEGGAEAASDIWGAVKNTAKILIPGSPEGLAAAKGIWHSLPPVELADSVKQTLPLIHAYETARASGSSISDALTATNEAAKQHMSNIYPIQQVVSAFRANPTRETARALTDAAAVAASMFFGGEVAAPAEEAEAVATTALPAESEAAATATKVPGAADFSSPSKPGLLQDVKSIVQGKSVAQPVAQQTVRQGVQAAAENAGTADEALAANIKTQPLLGRNQTILDDHLSSLRGQEQDAYERMDEAAGFDVKAEKSQLSNDQYKLKQLGNTDADIAQKEKLTASIQDSQARITDAESKMKDAGIDPTEADGLHKQRMAGADFKKALIQNTSSDGQTVNVDGLLNMAKKLQFSKYGNRLEQFFGSPEAADNFVSGLEAAQKAGARAAKIQHVAKWVGGLVVGGGIGGAAAKEGWNLLTE